MPYTEAQLDAIRNLVRGAPRIPIRQGANEIPNSTVWPPRDEAVVQITDLLQVAQDDLVCVGSMDQWEDDGQPPAGTRATPYLPKLPPGFTLAQLKSMTYWNAFAPAAGETLTLRIYKYLADGSGLVLMTDPLQINNSFADFTTVDVSSNIRANRYWAPGDILALSRVYVAGPARLQAPLIQWNFELTPITAPADTSTPAANAWPPI